MVAFTILVSAGLFAAATNAAPTLHQKRIAQVIADSTKDWEQACITAGGGAQCNPISQKAFGSLLAAGENCDQQDAADAMVDLAKTLNNDPNMIKLAQVFVQQPRNSPDSLQVPYCQKAPKNKELDGLFHCQFAGTVKDGANSKFSGDQTGNLPLGVTAVNPPGSCPASKQPVDDGKQLADNEASLSTGTGAAAKRSYVVGDMEDDNEENDAAADLEGDDEDAAADMEDDNEDDAADEDDDDDDDAAADLEGDDEDAAADMEDGDEDAAADMEDDDEDAAADEDDDEEDDDAAADLEGDDEDAAADMEDDDEDDAADEDEDDEDDAAADMEDDNEDDAADEDDDDDDDAAADLEGDDEDAAADMEDGDEDAAADMEGDDEDAAADMEDDDEDDAADEDDGEDDAAGDMENDDEDDAGDMEDDMEDDAGDKEDAAAKGYTPVYKRTATPKMTRSKTARSKTVVLRRAAAKFSENGPAAQKQNAEFATLAVDSPCTDGEQACVSGGFGQCVGGRFQVTPCAGGTKCFALPLVNKVGTSVTCSTEADAAARIAATGAEGGVADA